MVSRGSDRPPGCRTCASPLIAMACISADQVAHLGVKRPPGRRDRNRRQAAVALVCTSLLHALCRGCPATGRLMLPGAPQARLRAGRDRLGRALGRRSSRRPETRGPAEAIVAPTPLALQCSLADCWLLNHASRGHAGWLAAVVGNQRQAMLVLALRVRKHRALGDLHPPRRRRESNGFLTRAVEGDGMRVR